MHYVIKKIEEKQLNTNIPKFKSGDLIEVKIWVVEGDKRRIQNFEGIVIAIKNRLLNSAFTLRKISNNEGVERVFQTYSPIIHSINIKKRGIVRKAKLYYIRNKSGKSAKIKTKIN